MKTLGIDTHCDILCSTLQREDGAKRLIRGPKAQWSPEKALAGGLTVQTCAIFTAIWRKDPTKTVANGFRMAGLFRRLIDANPGILVQITESRQIREAHRTGRLGLLLSIEGAEPIGGDLDLLRAYIGLGVRVFGFAWNPANPLAMGCHGDPKALLTPLGRKALRLLNGSGVVVDVSHLNEGGFWDVERLSAAPFVATHSNARRLCDHPRNLTDSQLKALARRGGVAGAVFYAGFVRPHGPPSIQDLVAHVDHMVQVAGIDHVGIGADFEGMDRPVRGLEDVSKLPRLFEALSKRFSGREIAKIAGLNFLRVFESVF